MTALAINALGATRSGLKGDILLPLCCVQNLKTTHAKRTTQAAIKLTNKPKESEQQLSYVRAYRRPKAPKLF